MECTNVKKIKISQINPNNTVSETVIYINVDSGEQITETEAQSCFPVNALQIGCAVVC